MIHKAKEKQSEAGGDRKSSEYKKSVTPNLVEAVNNRVENETNSKLAKLAGVGKETYRMGVKILESNDEDLKQRVLSGETAINAGYNKIRENKKVEDNNVTTPTTQPHTTTPKNAPYKREKGFICIT